MDLCRICRAAPAISREHLVPSALGGRRDVAGVLCVACNSECGRTVDADCAASFALLRMLLGIVGDRGQAARVRATDSNGRRLDLGPGLSVVAAPGPPEILERRADFERVRFGSEQEQRRYIAAQRRKRPNETVSVLRTEEIRLAPGQVDLEFKLGGPGVMRSAVKSALVLIADRSHPETELEPAWRFVSTGATQEACQFNWTHAPPPWVPTADLGPLAHIIAVDACAQSRRITAHVQYFGHLGVCGTLARDVTTTAWQATYAVDPLSGTEEFGERLHREMGTPVSQETMNAFYDGLEEATCSDWHKRARCRARRAPPPCR